MGRLWFAFVAFTVGVCCVVDAMIWERLVRGWTSFPNDFATFWTAGRAPWSLVYQVGALTDLQSWAKFDPGAPRPFPYPPTLLFVLNPLGWMDRTPAFVLWTTAGLAAFAWASRRLAGAGWWLVLASPALTQAMVAGQLTLLVGGLLAGGILALPKRPLLAGLAFGVLATVKPQAALLVPVGLMAGGYWRTLGAAVAAGGLIGLASLAVHGRLWLQWLTSLGGFSSIIATQTWAPNLDVTPGALVQVLGLQGTPWAFAPPALGVVLALALAVVAFRRDEPTLRYGALASGYLLASPYALFYELALLQPVAVCLMMRRNWPARGAGWLAYILYPRWAAVIAMGLALLVSRLGALRVREA